MAPPWPPSWAAGIGAFAMGFVVIHQAGLFAVPALYAPAGGVTGRTTVAAVLWLVAWGVLHFRWQAREVDTGRNHPATLLLIALGILGTFPPVWKLL